MPSFPSEADAVFTLSMTASILGSFTREIDILIEDLQISELVNDRLFGWISFEILDDGSIQIDGVGAQRLYADCSHLPDDMFDRSRKELRPLRPLIPAIATQLFCPFS